MSQLTTLFTWKMIFLCKEMCDVNLKGNWTRELRKRMLVPVVFVCDSKRRARGIHHQTLGLTWAQSIHLGLSIQSKQKEMNVRVFNGPFLSNFVSISKAGCFQERNYTTQDPYHSAARMEREREREYKVVEILLP